MGSTRYGRGRAGVGDAGGCGAPARRHVPTSGGRKQEAGGGDRDSHFAGPLQALFHVRRAGRCVSAAGGNAEPPLV